MDQPIECFASLPYLRLPRFIIKRLILPSGKDESLYRVFAYLVYFARFGQDQPDPEAEAAALLWARLRGARSGRIAWQFACDWAGRTPEERTALSL